MFQKEKSLKKSEFKKFVTIELYIHLTVHWIEIAILLWANIITVRFKLYIYYNSPLKILIYKFAGRGGVIERSGRDIYRVLNLKRGENSGC